MQRLWSKFTVKSSSDGERIIEGIATTPRTDSSLDIVEPRGATFSLPIPVLSAHDTSKPVGEVLSANVSDRGITVRIKLAQVSEPPSLRERLDVAWAEIRAGLCRGLSIGFSPIEYEPIKGTYGVRYTKWSWRELSLVVIPSNEDASITAIRSADRAACARGASLSSGGRLDPAAAARRARLLREARIDTRSRIMMQYFSSLE